MITELTRRAIGRPDDWSQRASLLFIDLVEWMQDQAVYDDVIVESVKRTIGIVKDDFDLS